MAYQYKDTVYVPFINDTLVDIEARIERVNELIYEIQGCLAGVPANETEEQKKGQ